MLPTTACESRSRKIKLVNACESIASKTAIDNIDLTNIIS